MARRGALVLLALAIVVSLAGGARAYRGGPVTDEIENLFWVITIFALLVGAAVFALLFWFLYRYRQSVSLDPATEMHGNRRLEIVWTVIPTVILIIITLISVPVLVYTDTPPHADTTVTAIGERFAWTFRYEDGRNSSDLWIQEKIVVALDVTSIDVIHSLAVPDLGLKIDAIPGRMNHFWIQADAVGDHLVQCAEFCGTAHYGMRSTVHVFRAGSQPKIYGPPPAPLPIRDIELSGTTANGNITPQNFSMAIGSHVDLRIWNNASEPHDFKIDAPVNLSVSTIPPFGWRWLNFTANVPSPFPIPYGPTDGARAGGMVGNLSIQAGNLIRIDLIDGPGGFSLTPNPLKIAKGETVVFDLWNMGSQKHNFQLGAPYDFIKWTDPIDPGNHVVLPAYTFDEEAAGTYWCIIHRSNMFADYVVGAGAGAKAGVPLFDMVALTIAVSVPVMFVYLVHHARRREEPT